MKVLARALLLKGLRIPVKVFDGEWRTTEPFSEDKAYAWLMGGAQDMEAQFIKEDA